MREERKTIKRILMTRDGYTKEEADEYIAEAQAQYDLYLEEGDTEGAENICMEYFGLESDWLDEFI